MKSRAGDALKYGRSFHLVQMDARVVAIHVTGYH